MKLYLPRYRGAGRGRAAAAVRPRPAAAEAGETVLVVEDEPSVRELVVEVLNDLGYRALEAADGPSGLQDPAIGASASTCWSPMSACRA